MQRHHNNKMVHFYHEQPYYNIYGTEKRGQTETRHTVGQMFDDKIHELNHEIYLSKFESMKCPGMWMDI